MSATHAPAPIIRNPGGKPEGGVGGEDLSVYYPRLHRDGWGHVATESASRLGRRDVWEKRAPSGQAWLRKTTVAELPSAPGRGCYFDEHALRSGDGSVETPLPGAEWADFDHRGRLVVARAGRLEVLDTDRSPGRVLRELVDLNPNRPERRKAPDQARRW